MPDSLSPEPLCVACAVGGRFAVALAVMIRSLILNRCLGRPVTFYIFESDLSDLDHGRLELTATAEGVSVVWVQTDHSRLQGLPSAAHAAIYARLMVGDVLPPSVSKVIWLDADV